MSYDSPISLEGRRRYWQRHDWPRFIRHDAHRFAPPNTDECKSCAARLVQQRHIEEEQAARAAELRALHTSHLELRRQLADLKFELVWRRLCRKYGYNPAQPRDERGRWTDAGGGTAGAGTSRESLTTDNQGANAVGATGDNPPQSRVRLAGDPPPPLQRIHPDSTYERDAKAGRSLHFWRKQTTDNIVESLKPGNKESLIAHPDGRVKDGNTRLKVLQERGYNINSLPRTLQRGGGALPGWWPWQ